MEYRKIAFIGAGNMAHAIIAGLIRDGYPADLITACAPSEQRRQALSDKFHIHNSSDNIKSAQDAQVIVLGVKPQMMADVCQPLQQVDLSGKLVLLIAAGIQVSRFYQLLADNLNIVRIMPNTPSLIGKGMSGLYAPSQVSSEDRRYTEALMQSVGKTCWVDEESGINQVIAVSGSAPAYFFLFMEAMQQEAQKLGFDPQTARLLVQQTALGAAEMVVNNADISISTLREQVTSKGGTTAEAIGVFQQNGLADIVSSAMKAAITRAEEMEKQF